MWEKKSGSSDDTLHNEGLCYPWAGVCSGNGTTLCGTTADCSVAGGTCGTADCQTAAPNGLTIFQWVAQLNAAKFAGDTDWRVPNIKELQSIMDFQNFNPSVAAAFNTSCTATCTVTTCSCTQSDYYWSATTYADGAIWAWGVDFFNGYVFYDGKTTYIYVRAVRSGL